MRNFTLVALTVVALAAARTVTGLESESCDPETGRCGDDRPPPHHGGGNAPTDPFLGQFQQDGAEGGQNVDLQLQGRNKKDMEMYGNLLDRFEGLLNSWCCAATASPIYGVSGDRDVFNYVYYMMSHVLLREGQEYGSRLVLSYHMNRTLGSFSCEGIALGDTDFLGKLTIALLQYKDDLVEWLSHNEVQPDDIIEAYIPKVRETLGQWARSRLLFGHENLKEKPSAAILERVIDSILPVIEAGISPDVYCSAGGELWAVAQDITSQGRVRRAIDTMLESCYRHGKLAEDPTEYGNALRISGREDQARELYQLAVTRGKLCHPYQRPESHHRKDLTAKAVWTLDDFPHFKKALARENLVAKVAERLPINADAAAAFPYSGDRLTMAPYMKKGWFERTTVMAFGALNSTVCDGLGKEVCDAVVSVVDDVVAHNDGYAVMCNGSQAVELWRIGPDSESVATTGQANIVLQYVVLVQGNHDVVWQLGEEALMMDNTATAPGGNDAYVLDDTFENHVKVGRDGLQPDLPAVFLHIQLCHPDLHEKAVETPSKTCA